MKIFISSKAASSSVIQKGETLLGAETLPSKSHGLCLSENPPFLLFSCGSGLIKALKVNLNHVLSFLARVSDPLR